MTCEHVLRPTCFCFYFKFLGSISMMEDIKIKTTIKYREEKNMDLVQVAKIFD